MATRRQQYTQRYFRGIYDSESPLDAALYARDGYLTDCRNYHVNRGLLKRQGTTPLTATAFASETTLQGGAMYRWGSTRHLVVLGGGALKRLNGSAWTAITGSLTLATAESARLRTAHFTDASNNLLLGCNGYGNNAPWQWTGSGDATALSGTGAPTSASDMCQFKGHIVLIGTNAGAPTTQYSKYGLANIWPTDNKFDASRESEGVNCVPLNDEVCLLFHRKSIHRLTFNYGIGVTANIFVEQPLDSTVGSWARAGVAVVNGKCYFIGGKESPMGFYCISDPQRPAKYIGKPVRETFASLERARIEQASVVVRGEPWNEIAWLFTSRGGTEHDMQIIYNYEFDTWSVFDSDHADYAYASACRWVDSSENEHTLLLGYDGFVYDAWGDGTTVDTGNLDHGASGGYIQALFESGYLDLGYRGQKALRELWYDVETSERVQFAAQVRAVSTVTTPSRIVTAGKDSDKLGPGFILGTSKLSSVDVQQAKRKMLRDGRFMRLRSTESGTAAPHRIQAVHWLFRPQGMTLN